MHQLSYATKVLAYSFQNFAARADLTYAVISIAAALWLGPSETALTEFTTYDLAIYSAYALGAYLLLRLLVAGPYYVWKEEKCRADELQTIAENPARLEREAFATLRAQKRLDLLAAIRLTHAAAIHKDEAGWKQGTSQIIALEPLAISDGSHRKELTDFLELSEGFLHGKELDGGKVQTASEDLMRKLHRL